MNSSEQESSSCSNCVFLVPRFVLIYQILSVCFFFSYYSYFLFLCFHSSVDLCLFCLPSPSPTQMTRLFVNFICLFFSVFFSFFFFVVMFSVLFVYFVFLSYAYKFLSFFSLFYLFCLHSFSLVRFVMKYFYRLNKPSSQVVHKQFNSPIGLYSDNNIENTIRQSAPQQTQTVP